MCQDLLADVELYCIVVFVLIVIIEYIYEFAPEIKKRMADVCEKK